MGAGADAQPTMCTSALEVLRNRFTVSRKAGQHGYEEWDARRLCNARSAETASSATDALRSFANRGEAGAGRTGFPSKGFMHHQLSSDLHGAGLHHAGTTMESCSMARRGMAGA